ncbi:hypothetical protein FQA47_015169 [Oryzias melastigma]|uniref:Uncharacterized protein n=1 Tax=Oryzias melastigma TaxID=30732 RepID=A0A834CG54_ORYME|nr:hypothetical protein FQA47_015169 [Oryzias melastigma]
MLNKERVSLVFNVHFILFYLLHSNVEFVGVNLSQKKMQQEFNIMKIICWKDFGTTLPSAGQPGDTGQILIIFVMFTFGKNSIKVKIFKKKKLILLPLFCMFVLVLKSKREHRSAPKLQPVKSPSLRNAKQFHRK